MESCVLDPHIQEICDYMYICAIMGLQAYCFRLSQCTWGSASLDVFNYGIVFVCYNELFPTPKSAALPDFAATLISALKLMKFGGA
jgi:hypothetical protein